MQRRYAALGCPAFSLRRNEAQTAILTMPGAAIELQQHCSYKAARGNALQMTAPSGCPDLTGADVHLLIAAQQAGKPIMPPMIDISGCSIIGATTAISADVSTTQTGSLTNFAARAYAWCFVAFYPETGDEIAITDWGDCSASPGVAHTS